MSGNGSYSALASGASKPAGNALFGLYLLVLVLAPLPLGSNRDWAWPVVSILSMVLVLGLVFNVSNLAWQQTEKVVLAAFVALMSWMLLQYTGIPGVLSPVTIDPLATRIDLLKTVGFACFFVATLLLADSRARIEMIAYTIVLLGVTQALIGSAQQLVFDLPRARGTFPNPNHYAGYLEVALAFGIGLILSRQDDPGLARHPLLDFVAGPKGRLRVLIIIMVIGLIMSRSRMGNLGFLTSILLTSAVAFHHTRHLSRNTIIMLASIFLLDVLIIGNYFGLERLEQRLRESPAAVAGRADLFDYNLRIIGDHPVTGVGAGSYETAMRAYRDEHISGRPAHAENDYLEFMAELGVIGVVPLAIILLLGVRQQVLLLACAHSFDRGIAFGCLMATICLLFHAFGDVNLQIPSNGLMMVAMLAMPFALARVSRVRRCSVSRVKEASG